MAHVASRHGDLRGEGADTLPGEGGVVGQPPLHGAVEPPAVGVDAHRAGRVHGRVDAQRRAERAAVPRAVPLEYPVLLLLFSLFQMVVPSKSSL